MPFSYCTLRVGIVDIMKFKLKALLLGAIVLVLSIVTILCSKSMPESADANDYLIQCVIAKHNQSKPFKARFNHNEHNCHVLLWQVPKKYQAVLRTNAGAEINDSKVGPALLIKRVPERVLPFFLEKKPVEGIGLLVKAANPAGTISRISQLKKGHAISWELEKMDETLNGFTVYYNAERSKLMKKPASVMLSKTKLIELNIVCNAFGLYSFKEIPDAEYCDVETEIDARTIALYKIHYGQIDEIDLINQTIITFVKGLMLN